MNLNATKTDFALKRNPGNHFINFHLLNVSIIQHKISTTANQPLAKSLKNPNPGSGSAPPNSPREGAAEHRFLAWRGCKQRAKRDNSQIVKECLLQRFEAGSASFQLPKQEVKGLKVWRQRTGRRHSGTSWIVTAVLRFDPSLPAKMWRPARRLSRNVSSEPRRHLGVMKKLPSPCPPPSA